MFRGAKRKLFRRFLWRPGLVLTVEFLVLAPLVLAGDPATSIGGLVFFLPWLLALFILINLPFMKAAFLVFRLDRQTRRNHALEHATIHVLETGRAGRLGGRAMRNGFWIVGRVSPQEIRKAFEDVRRMVGQGQRLPYISRRCGSNRASAQGLALLLLLSVALVSLLIQPPLAVRAGALAFVVVFFVSMRYVIGNRIQGWFFMATDFDEVSVRDVRRFPSAPPDRPAYFVETMIRSRPPGPPSGS